MSWKTLEEGNPNLAAFGAARLHGQVAYLATVRKDGAPRVHPMTPIIGEGHFFVFMEPTSPKGHDLQRDGRFAIHCSVANISGGNGEFTISGKAQLIDDPKLRSMAVRLCPYTPAERYILFEFDPERAASTVYAEDRTIRQEWKREQPSGSL